MDMGADRSTGAEEGMNTLVEKLKMLEEKSVPQTEKRNGEGRMENMVHRINTLIQTTNASNPSGILMSIL